MMRSLSVCVCRWSWASCDGVLQSPSAMMLQHQHHTCAALSLAVSVYLIISCGWFKVGPEHLSAAVRTELSEHRGTSTVSPLVPCCVHCLLWTGGMTDRRMIWRTCFIRTDSRGVASDCHAPQCHPMYCAYFLPATT